MSGDTASSEMIRLSEATKPEIVVVRIVRDSVRIFHNGNELGEKGAFEDFDYEVNSASNACYLLGLLAKSGIIRIRIDCRVKNESYYTKLLKGEPLA